jgi:hypothetical protein
MPAELSHEDRLEVLNASHRPASGRDQIGVLAVDDPGSGGLRAFYWHDDFGGLAKWYVDGFFPLYGAASEDLTDHERAHIDELRAAASKGNLDAVADLIVDSGDQTTIRWVGRFSDLLSSDDDESVELREEFWEREADEDDESVAATDPIPEDRNDDFGQWLWELGFG